MPRLLTDPHLQQCPSYQDPEYEEFIIDATRVGESPEDVIARLAQAWNTHNTRLKEAWDLQVQEDGEAAAAEEQARKEEEALAAIEAKKVAAAEKAEADKKKPHLLEWSKTASIESSVRPRPSAFAIHKLKSFEYIELCYAITSIGSGLQLRPTVAHSPSKKVIKDADLTWIQFDIAKIAYMRELDKCGWDKETITSMANFFYDVQNNPLLEEEYGIPTLLRYQASTRKRWHERLKEGTSFNISIFNEDLLQRIATEIIRQDMLNSSHSAYHALADTRSSDQSRSVSSHSSKLKRSWQATPDDRNIRRQLSPPCNSPHTRAWLHQRMRTAPKRGVGAGVFEPTRTPAPRSLAQSVWATSSPPKSPSATPESSGVEAHHGAVVTQGAVSSTPKALKSASIGNAPMDVIPSSTTTSTNALDVVAPLTECTIALSLRWANPLTPYHAEAWRQALSAASLLAKYPSVYSGLTSGFDIGIPCISQMHAPFNSPTLHTYQEVFSSIIYNEFARSRYLGPFLQSELQLLIGPFQSSPLSLVPKPHKLNSFCLVQNYSYPHIPSPSYSSINSHINSDNYPCTWGTFTAIALTIARLPPGSQAAVRDVSKAYQTMPLHSSQWPGTVVRLHEADSFAIDTCTCFGVASNAGVYGHIDDAAIDIFRSKGLGPVSKWVDDHVFFRILASLSAVANITPGDGYGRAYLTGLEAMLTIFHDSPFKPRSPPRSTPSELIWWRRILECEDLVRQIPGPVAVANPQAFSDASSGVGIGVWIAGRWRAWKLKPGWKADDRDIGWAEAISFKFVIHILLAQPNHSNLHRHLKVSGDNKGVVEGWWNGRSRNRQVNINTSSAPKTQQTIPREVDSDPLTSFSPQYQSLLNFRTSLAILTSHLDPLLSPILSVPRPSCLQSQNDHVSTQNPSAMPLNTNSSRRKHPQAASTKAIRTCFDVPITPSPSLPFTIRSFPSGLNPASSPLHPLCLARDRLKLWRPAKTPRALDSPLSEADSQRIEEVMGHRWKMSTLETYGSGLLVFHVICDRKGISEDQCAPAHPDLLLAFLATLSGSYSASTLSNYLSGVRAWHLLHGLSWLVNADSTTILMHSAAVLAPPSSKRKPRSPYTTDFLVNMRQQLNLSLPLDAAVWACTTSLFYGVARTGELTTSNLSSFLPFTHVTRVHVSSKVDRNNGPSPSSSSP
ncbi:hypothetical protein EW146_g7975 [Bondarzewia mesenterica]|uniref:Uncharacterized protein n=1 Tax=Bondarzewia mesenterica TaxID=1095465 RepID=A0A4S4LIL1_9AGAM|nr:hypothetical protein EW146_g7975 [Bondarzewia mesenterica]